MDNIINENQTGYIKGRFIGNNSRLILDILEYCENNNKDGILLFADFQKAFDSVEWNFLFKTLQKFNFGPNFIKWIQILYKNPCFYVKNNGWLSRKCRMERGIRQGCPVSALLFLFVMEILNLKIQNCGDIKGFKISSLEKEIKCIQHADDSTFTLEDQLSLENALNILKKFGKMSGTNLNMTKTECIILGPLRERLDRQTHVYQVRINKDTLKCLGIYVGLNKNICNEKNWICKLKEFEKILDSWRCRKLTIFGKCQIINSIILSKIIFTATVLENPGNDYFKKLNKLFFSFLWGNRERIKRHTLIREIKEGGIGIIDPEIKIKATKAAWISKLTQNKSNLSKFLNACLANHKMKIEYILESNVTNTSDFNSLKGLPQFYKEVFTAFNECKTPKSIDTVEEILRQNIWFNVNFKYKGKVLYFQNWFESGFHYVKDLVNDNGFRSLNEIATILKSKRNYLCEYLTLKNVFHSKIHNDTSRRRYINIKNEFHFKLQGEIKDIGKTKSGFFYKILLDDKSKKPIMESKWKNEFGDINSLCWRKIYDEKIVKINDKSIAEFNFKLLHNLLPNNLYLSKWNKNIDKFCTYCREIENTKHMVFDCILVKNIWKKVSAILKINIAWKHLVLGFIYNGNQSNVVLNNVISFIACKIFKYKMKCKLIEDNVTNEGLILFLRSSLASFFLVNQQAQTVNFDYCILRTLSEML